jgi:hypothetical protein
MGRAGVSMTKSPFGGELDLARTGVTRSDQRQDRQRAPERRRRLRNLWIGHGEIAAT